MLSEKNMGFFKDANRNLKTKKNSKDKIVQAQVFGQHKPFQ